MIGIDLGSGSTAVARKVADIDARIRQRSVIESLNAEDEPPIRIHERLKNVYGDVTVDLNTIDDEFVAVERQTLLADEKWTGRSLTVVLQAIFNESIISFVMATGWLQMRDSV
ncbi:hypothetical protein Trydic_g16610 [Trypoxylus dichotomus]